MKIVCHFPFIHMLFSVPVFSGANFLLEKCKHPQQLVGSEVKKKKNLDSLSYLILYIIMTERQNLSEMSHFSLKKIVLTFGVEKSKRGRHEGS